MPNKYLSRYAKHETHFNRTDPFPYATWADQSNNLDLIIGAIAFAGLIALLFI